MGADQSKGRPAPAAGGRAAAQDPPSPEPQRTFDAAYTRGKKLGEGAFSVVIEAAKKETDDSYAVKVVTKAKLTREDEAALKQEIEILAELRHKHIIRLYDVFNERRFWYLVTEQMAGGELFDRIVQKSFYNEGAARDVCKILFEAVGYCHGLNIVHRDLKPENLLLAGEESDSEIKIADFGFAKRAEAPDSLKTQCGTPGYVAPEILEGVGYGAKSDMWSLGVIAYILLGGYPPFIEQDRKVLFKKIRKGKFEFHDEYWGAVSDDAKDLISKLLTVDPGKRMSAKEALGHTWMVKDADALEGQDLGANLEKLREFNARKRFRAAVNAVIAANRVKLTSLGVNFKDDLE